MLKRPLAPMPETVHQALLDAGLTAAYEARPAYQRNDYLRWINQARLPATKDKRIAQMLAELERGDRYMNMAWTGGR